MPTPAALPSFLIFAGTYLVLALGKLPGLSDIEIVTARRVVIDGPIGDPVQGDGDIIARLPVTIELSPVALELMRP